MLSHCVLTVKKEFVLRHLYLASEKCFSLTNERENRIYLLMHTCSVRIDVILFSEIEFKKKKKKIGYVVPINIIWSVFRWTFRMLYTIGCHLRKKMGTSLVTYKALCPWAQFLLLSVFFCSCAFEFSLVLFLSLRAVFVPMHCLLVLSGCNYKQCCTS